MAMSLTVAEVEEHVRGLVSGLDATVAADATIGREDMLTADPSAAFPTISIAPEESNASANAARAASDLQLVGLLGRGGMGAVYVARQHALDREVALKRPLVRFASEDVQRALLAEGRLMGTLEHPNIVPVHALGLDDDGMPVIVMKRVEGVSWRDLLRDPEHPMWERVSAGRGKGLAFHVEVLRSVCDALQFAHTRGIIHRDVKPENVMVGAFGEVYLLDWGIAVRIGTASSSLAGTPAYMAPEMVLDPSSADARTDVYLLGATLHEVLVGEAIHQAHSLESLLRAILLREPYAYPPSVPVDLARLVERATAREPEARMQSAIEFREALASYVTRRASRELAALARARLAEVEAKLAESPHALDSVELGVVLAEARFGFAQSVREWPGNDDARDGLTRCLTLAFDREIAQGNAVAARALLAESPHMDETRRARLHELERSIAESRALAEAAAERARQMDASVSAWPRLLGFAGFMLTGGVLSLGAFLDEQENGTPMSMAYGLTIDASVLCALALALLFGRKRLLANAYNRRIWGIWSIVLLAVASMDTYFYFRGLDVYIATVVDFGMMAVVFASAAFTFSRFLGWCTLVAGTASAGSAFFPKASTALGTMALFTVIALVVEDGRRNRTRSDLQPVSPLGDGAGRAP